MAEPGWPEARWNLVDFDRRLDEWAIRGEASEAQRQIAANWALGVMEDPYRGMKREGAYVNLWYGLLPGSNDADERVVTCSYWIIEATRTVRCDRFDTMQLPL